MIVKVITFGVVNVKNVSISIYEIIDIILRFYLQGYEGSLLKVTSKNGKTASVSVTSNILIASVN